VFVVILGIGAMWLNAKPQAPSAPPATPVPSALKSGTTSQAIHKIDSLSTNVGGKAALIMGASNKVLVVATISDAAVIPQSVILFRQNFNGSPLLIGALHDDGLNGDLIAGDKDYTIALDGTSFTTVGNYGMFVTAAFHGAVQRIQSNPITISVVAATATVDNTWKTFQDAQLSIKTPGKWIASTNVLQASTTQSTGPVKTLSFFLPTDTDSPVLYILSYPHGFQFGDNVDEPPTFLGTNNSYDFYFQMRNADTDPSVLVPLGLTDDSLNAQLLQAIATFRTH